MGRSSDGLTQPMSLMFVLGNVDLEKVKAYMREHREEFYEKTQFELLDAGHLSVNGFYSKLLQAKERGELHIDRDIVLFFQTARLCQITVNMTLATKVDAANAWQLTNAEIALRRQDDGTTAFFRRHIPGLRDLYVTSGLQAGVRESRRSWRLRAAGPDIIKGWSSPM